MKPCVFHADDWLSRWLGKPAFHLTGNFLELSAKEFPASPAFVDAKVPVEDLAALAQLQRLGMLLVDTNVQLLRPAEPFSLGSVNVRMAKPEDETSVQELAASAFLYDRFHQDPSIGDPIASDLKKAWAGNFFRGLRGQWMVVAEHQQKIVGFLQLLKASEEQIIIDLIAVAEQQRGTGVARTMIAFAGQECLQKPAAILVGTQIANIPSLVLYQKLGFVVRAASYVFHWHSQPNL